jgi:hypothetical protein
MLRLMLTNQDGRMLLHDNVPQVVALMLRESPDVSWCNPPVSVKDRVIRCDQDSLWRSFGAVQSAKIIALFRQHVLNVNQWLWMKEGFAPNCLD